MKNYAVYMILHRVFLERFDFEHFTKSYLSHVPFTQADEPPPPCVRVVHGQGDLADGADEDGEGAAVGHLVVVQYTQHVLRSKRLQFVLFYFLMSHSH